MLGNTAGPGDWDWGLLASVRGRSVACLAAAWALVAVCLVRGVKTSGKVGLGHKWKLDQGSIRSSPKY